MTRKHLYLILLLCGIFAAYTQAQVLYRISGNSMKAPAYLFASNKITDISFIDSIPNLLSCFNQCQSVITEFAMQDYELLSTLRTAALLPDSIRLDQYFTSEQYKAIDEAMLLTTGFSMDQLCRMKPSYLTAMYRNELLRKWLAYDENRSMEIFFQALAADKQMPVIGLDDIGETMFMLFDREPFQWQCKELAQIIEYPEREIRLEKDITALYRMGRLNDIAFLITAPDNNSTLSYSDYQVYAARNKEWVKKLRSHLINGNVFITLDAMYIGGEKGLIEQLRAAGYRVRPVNR